jgi:hypothetical protein
MGLPTMSGNYTAGKHLTPYQPLARQGYTTHAVTTGISAKLFEGHTIAEFDPASVTAAGCTPIMYNSRGGVSVILREPRAGCGQVRDAQGGGVGGGGVCVCGGGGGGSMYRGAQPTTAACGGM